MTRIKICGLKSGADIDDVNLILPDYIGFVFAPKSHRYVTPEQAGALRKKLDPDIVPVGVFVDEPLARVAALLSDGVIDIAQLHGGEDEKYIAALRALTNKPIMKAFKVETAGDVKTALGSTADYILLDSGAGGTGKVFNWSLLERIGRPYFLAGGLAPDNVAEAVKMTRPFAVDVSSGVETGGKKDAEKIKMFVKAVRKD